MRKTILVIACLVGLTAPATAYTAADYDEACRSTGQFAEAALEARYLGVPAPTVMQNLPTGTGYPTLERLMRSIVLDAYNLPHMQTPAFRDHQQRSFVNEIEVMCLQVFHNTARQ